MEMCSVHMLIYTVYTVYSGVASKVRDVCVQIVNPSENGLYK